MFEKEYEKLEQFRAKVLAVKGVIRIEPFYVHDSLTVVCEKKDKVRIRKELENIVKEEKHV